MSRGCLREVSKLSSILQSVTCCCPVFRKATRLILDLSHLNKFVVKKSVKYEDLRTVLQLFSPGMFFFRLTLHWRTITLPSVKSIWSFCRSKGLQSTARWNYEFKVLPFGLTSAPYVFTKVMRQLVKFWRGCGLLALMYLDDGIGGNWSCESAKNISVQVCKDLASAAW